MDILQQTVEQIPLLQEHHRLPSGKRLIILPTSTKPLSHLNPENWTALQKAISHGHRRRIRNITVLKDGTKTDLYVKGPEIRFNGDCEDPHSEYIWWGGPKSGERCLVLRGAEVYAQTEWEAAILIALVRKNIRAEIPEAIIEAPDGYKELIVSGVANLPYGVKPQGVKMQPSFESILSEVKRAGFKPEDTGHHNIVSDEEGAIHLIDVNRWEWPPYTDEFRRRLFKLIVKSRSDPPN